MFSIFFDFAFILKCHITYISHVIPEYQPLGDKKALARFVPSTWGDITRQGLCVTSEMIFWYVTLEAIGYICIIEKRGRPYIFLELHKGAFDFCLFIVNRAYTLNYCLKL